MLRRWMSLFVIAISAMSVLGSDLGLTAGSPALKSAGPLAFGPDGVLFVGDPVAATIFALQTDDVAGEARPINISDVGEKVAGMLGATTTDVTINDLAVNPKSGNVYLSVARGRGPHATPVILRVSAEGEISDISLKDVNFARTQLSNAPAEGAKSRRNEDQRRESITDLAYIDGRLIVAGLSNEEFASKLRSIAFPFVDADPGTSVEVFHGAHGRLETRSPVRTFVTYEIDKNPHVLAAYTCTPLVTFPVSSLQPGTKIMGRTVAELGNRNRPLDMIVYQKNGSDYLLLTNSSRGVMKIALDSVATVDEISEPVEGGSTAGLHYETIESLADVTQMDQLDDGHAVILVQRDNSASLVTMELP